MVTVVPWRPTLASLNVMVLVHVSAMSAAVWSDIPLVRNRSVKSMSGPLLSMASAAMLSPLIAVSSLQYCGVIVGLTVKEV